MNREEARRWMAAALEFARRGRGTTRPNPMVGAVLVRGGRVIGEGYHGRFGGPHGEVAALEDARLRGDEAGGATLYCTLEPCSHHGKTPPCATAVADAGIGRAVLATLDPEWAAQAAQGEPRGVDALRRAGIRTDVGLLADEAVVLNAAFFKRSRTGLPLVIAKWAMSADGKIATRTGASRWISCAESRHLVHDLRGRMDAVVVGGSTAELDDPLLTCREAEKLRTATRVVLCGSRAPGPESKLVQTCGEGPVLLAHVAACPPPGLEALAGACAPGPGCGLLPLPAAEGRAGHVCPRALLRALAGRGASNVLVEGGREALGSFFDNGLVDRVMVFVAPIVLGGSEAVTAVGGTGAETVARATGFLGDVYASRGRTAHTCVRQVGRDVLIEGWTSDPLQWSPPEPREEPEPPEC